MRQIELHRADASVPLKPPPHPVTRFFKRNWFVLVFGTLNFSGLLHEIFEKSPLTRYEAFNIALTTAGLMIVFVTDVLRRMSRMMEKTWEIILEDEMMIRHILEKTAPSKSSEGAAIVQAEHKGGG